MEIAPAYGVMWSMPRNLAVDENFLDFGDAGGL
jgi:hypothetical protein